MCIFCAGVPAYACMKAGAAALKSHCASNIFLRESNCLNALHCLAVPSEGTRPQGRGVPKYEKKCTFANFPEEKLHESAFC